MVRYESDYVSNTNSAAETDVGNKLSIEWQSQNRGGTHNFDRGIERPEVKRAASVGLGTWSYYDHVKGSSPPPLDRPSNQPTSRDSVGSGQWSFYDHQIGSNMRPQGVSPWDKHSDNNRRVDKVVPGSERYTPGQSDFNGTADSIMNSAAGEAGGRVGRMVRTSKGIYLKSNFDVDVDGSPRARQIDRYGQTQTSWSYSNAKGHKYINAERVPFIVLPMGKYKQFGIKLGDYALVRDTKTNKMAVAVFADVGPRSKTGEGSIYLGNQELGLNVTPNRGVSQKRFEYLVFPGSGEGRARNEAHLHERIRNFRNRILNS